MCEATRSVWHLPQTSDPTYYQVVVSWHLSFSLQTETYATMLEMVDGL